jgi:urease accessory protein
LQFSVIKKVIEIKRDIESNDEVALSWFDMQKPNLTAVSKKNINIVVKVKFSHLHEDDILVNCWWKVVLLEATVEEDVELDFDYLAQRDAFRNIETELTESTAGVK